MAANILAAENQMPTYKPSVQSICIYRDWAWLEQLYGTSQTSLEEIERIVLVT